MQKRNWTFRGKTSFLRTALAVTAAAFAAGIAAPLVFGGSFLGGAAALFGGTIAAAFALEKPRATWAKLAIGLGGGALGAAGYVALASGFGLGVTGLLAGGALGGLALGSLLTADADAFKNGRDVATGLVGSTALGAIGAVAGTQIALYAASTDGSVVLTSGVVAGLAGLWMSAGAGLGRVQRDVDPLIARADALLETVADPIRTRVSEAKAAYLQVLNHATDGHLENSATAADIITQAEALFGAVVATGENYLALGQSAEGDRAVAIDEKLRDLAMRSESTTDAVTLGHLARAQQALRAQKTAMAGLLVAKGRAEAAVDAQGALLDRLRLAVVQYLHSDRERFALEFEAVGDQVARLTDDLESLSAALDEAEAFSDRRVLAGVERAGRRALASLNDDARAVLDDIEQELERDAVEVERHVH